MKGYISLEAVTNQSGYTGDDILRMGASGDLAIYVQGEQFILSPDFATCTRAPEPVAAASGMIGFSYSGPVRLSNGAIKLIREKGSIPASGPQTFYYVEKPASTSLTLIPHYTHPQYRELPDILAEFIYSQESLSVILKYREANTTARRIGTGDNDFPILVSEIDIRQLSSNQTALANNEMTRHPKQQRQDLLTPIINKLQSQCTDPFSAAELWPKLVSLASGEDPPPPLIGYNDDFIKWEKELDKIAHLSKKALSERLRKQKNRRL